MWFVLLVIVGLYIYLTHKAKKDKEKDECIMGGEHEWTHEKEPIAFFAGSRYSMDWDVKTCKKCGKRLTKPPYMRPTPKYTETDPKPGSYLALREAELRRLQKEDNSRNQ